MKVLSSMIYDQQVSAVTFQWINVAKQRGSNDCGLFAIANSTSLCLGQDPARLVYDQADMRSHLRECFITNKMTMFTVESYIQPRGYIIKQHIYHIV